jgi:hypothetical protein
MRQLEPHQYIPFNHVEGNIDLIVYPIITADDLHILLPQQTDIQTHLHKLYVAQSDKLDRGVYHIVFIWNRHGQLMTDIWVYQRNMIDSIGGETSIESCLTFQDITLYTPAGIASENTLVTMGREQEHRWKFDTLQEYLDRSKSLPDFPEGYIPNKKY